MMLTTLGWALVALAVAVAVVFVPILYAVHLVVLHERLREHTMALATPVEIPVQSAIPCPYCGEIAGSPGLAYDTYSSDSVAVAS